MPPSHSYEKHGESLKKLGVQLVGKRIFIRIRKEVDDEFAFLEEVKTLVPPPEGQAERPKRPNSFEDPSKILRTPFVTTL